MRVCHREVNLQSICASSCGIGTTVLCEVMLMLRSAHSDSRATTVNIEGQIDKCGIVDSKGPYADVVSHLAILF